MTAFLVTGAFVASRRKAIQSLRLRLRSGLRQSGSVFDAAVYGRVGDPALPGVGAGLGDGLGDGRERSRFVATAIRLRQMQIE